MNDLFTTSYSSTGSYNVFGVPLEQQTIFTPTPNMPATLSEEWSMFHIFGAPETAN
jgi:hypothetical protein